MLSGHHASVMHKVQTIYAAKLSKEDFDRRGRPQAVRFPPSPEAGPPPGICRCGKACRRSSDALPHPLVNELLSPGTLVDTIGRPRLRAIVSLLTWGFLWQQAVGAASTPAKCSHCFPQVSRGLALPISHNSSGERRRAPPLGVGATGQPTSKA